MLDKSFLNDNEVIIAQIKPSFSKIYKLICLLLLIDFTCFITLTLVFEILPKPFIISLVVISEIILISVICFVDYHNIYFLTNQRFIISNKFSKIKNDYILDNILKMEVFNKNTNTCNVKLKIKENQQIKLYCLHLSDVQLLFEALIKFANYKEDEI